MEPVWYWLARGLLAPVQVLPLAWVARLGQVGGGVAYWLDRRHRRAARQNLARCFGTGCSPGELRAIARANFRRIGENFACAARTAAMTSAEIARVLTVQGIERLGDSPDRPSRSKVVAIGHFGNFELYARVGQFLPGFQFATTYRALRQPSLNRLLQGLRARSGCLYFERRTELRAVQEAMRTQRLVLGFLADQHAGDRGLPVPFFGEVCSTSAAPAVFALRYQCPLLVAICYRTGLSRWRIEIGEEIPTHHRGQPRSVEDITHDINRAFESAVRRDPANWFWVHQRWKPGHFRTRPSGPRPRSGSGERAS